MVAMVNGCNVNGQSAICLTYDDYNGGHYDNDNENCYDDDDNDFDNDFGDLPHWAVCVQVQECQHSLFKLMMKMILMTTILMKMILMTMILMTMILMTTILVTKFL